MTRTYRCWHLALRHRGKGVRVKGVVKKVKNLLKNVTVVRLFCLNIKGIAKFFYYTPVKDNIACPLEIKVFKNSLCSEIILFCL